MSKNKLPNIILIVCDTLGAKHMSLYGYHRKTTPNLERMVEEDNFTVYTRCFSPAPWTVPAHASLFTGLYPSEHGIDGGNFYLNERSVLLSELIRSSGYKTYGISSNTLVSKVFGYQKGFDEFHEVWNLFDEGGSEAEINRKIFSIKKSNRPFFLLKSFIKENNRIPALKIMLNKLYGRYKPILRNSTPSTYNILKIINKIFKNHRTSDKPFFLFVNFMQTHDKYNPPLNYRNIFVKDNPHFDKRHQKEDEYMHYAVKPFEEDFLKYLEGLYDQEVLFLDTVIYQLYQTLKESNLFNNTILIITSDHGELFGEHNHIHHLFTTHNELIHVPLIIYYPWETSIRSDNRLVQLHDLYSTILEIVDSPYPNPSSSLSLCSSGKRCFAISQIKITDFKLEACKERNPDFSPEWNGIRLDKGEIALILMMENGELWKYVKTEDGFERIYDLSKGLYKSEMISHTNKENLTLLRQLFTAVSEITGYDQS